MLRVITAAIGAKNGCWCPSTTSARKYAPLAAMAVCRIDHKLDLRRSVAAVRKRRSPWNVLASLMALYSSVLVRAISLQAFMPHYHNKRNMTSQRRAHVTQYETRHDWSLPLLLSELEAKRLELPASIVRSQAF